MTVETYKKKAPKEAKEFDFSNLDLEMLTGAPNPDGTDDRTLLVITLSDGKYSIDPNMINAKQNYENQREFFKGPEYKREEDLHRCVALKRRNNEMRRYGQFDQYEIGRLYAEVGLQDEAANAKTRGMQIIPPA